MIQFLIFNNITIEGPSKKYHNNNIVSIKMIEMLCYIFPHTKFSSFSALISFKKFHYNNCKFQIPPKIKNFKFSLI